MAWLETAGSDRIPVSGVCTFGRTSGNTVTLDTPKASRRHAMIHEQDHEFWIVDLGSTNGVQVNGKRVIHPIRLQTADHIEMPGQSFTFRLASEPEAPASKRRAPAVPKQHRLTVPDIRLVTCWLLVADLQGFTTMSQRINPEELAPLVGKWMASCQRIITSKNGVLAKFLGDGFLAYWTNREEAVTWVVSACREFQELQKGSLPFRIMLHQGLVSFGGHSPDASHTMMGQELNFAFRLEKLAARLNLSWIFSDVAESQLGDSLPLVSCGPQRIPDFEAERVCFTLAV